MEASDIPGDDVEISLELSVFTGLCCFAGVLFVCAVFCLTSAPILALSSRPVSIRSFPAPCLGPSMPLPAGRCPVSGSDTGCCTLPGKLTAYGRVYP